MPTVLVKQEHRVPGRAKSYGLPLRTLVGAGDRIALSTLPAVVTGAALNILYPSVFAVGGPPTPLRAVSIAVLAIGVVLWALSVVLIVRRVPRDELIRTDATYGVALLRAIARRAATIDAAARRRAVRH